MASTRLRPPISANGWRLVRKTQPYSKRIAHKGIWVEPKLLAEIEDYRAKSAEGKVRHPFYRGLREHVQVGSGGGRPNPARTAARLPIAPSPFPSGRPRLAIVCRWPRPRPEGRSPIRFTLLCDVHSARHLPGNRLTDGEKLRNPAKVVSDKPFVLRSSG